MKTGNHINTAAGGSRNCPHGFSACNLNNGRAILAALGQRLRPSPPAGGEASVVGEEKSSPSLFPGGLP